MKRKADIKADDSDDEPLVNKTSNASKKNDQFYQMTKFCHYQEKFRRRYE